MGSSFRIGVSYQPIVMNFTWFVLRCFMLLVQYLWTALSKGFYFGIFMLAFFSILRAYGHQVDGVLMETRGYIVFPCALIFLSLFWLAIIKSPVFLLATLATNCSL